MSKKAYHIHSTNTGVKQAWVNGRYLERRHQTMMFSFPQNTSVVPKIALGLLTFFIN